MRVVVNEKLKKDIFESMPEGLNNLEKALYIYEGLCQRVDYSMDYYLDADGMADWYMNPKNIQLIDGETRKDVVCFTFNPIYLELLIEAGVCKQDMWEHNDLINRSGRFYTMHESLHLIIDGMNFEVDATLGVLEDNDLVLLKYSGNYPEGWVPLTPKAEKAYGEARDKVFETRKMLQNLTDKYLKLKRDGVMKMPLEERVECFKKALDNMPPYSMFSFNYLLELRRKFFTDEDIGKTTVVQKVELLFVKDVKSHDYKAFFFFNPAGYVNDYGYENFDKLQVIEIDVRQHKVKPISLQEFREQVNTGKLLLKNNNKLDHGSVPMTEKGDLYLYKETKPQAQGGVHGVSLITGYIRTHLLTGKSEHLSANEGERLIRERNNEK